MPKENTRKLSSSNYSYRSAFKKFFKGALAIGVSLIMKTLRDLFASDEEISNINIGLPTNNLALDIYDVTAVDAPLVYAYGVAIDGAVELSQKSFYLIKEAIIKEKDENDIPELQETKVTKEKDTAVEVKQQTERESHRQKPKGNKKKQRKALTKIQLENSRLSQAQSSKKRRYVSPAQILYITKFGFESLCFLFLFLTTMDRLIGNEYSEDIDNIIKGAEILKQKREDGLWENMIAMIFCLLGNGYQLYLQCQSEKGDKNEPPIVGLSTGIAYYVLKLSMFKYYSSFLEVSNVIDHVINHSSKINAQRHFLVSKHPKFYQFLSKNPEKTLEEYVRFFKGNGGSREEFMNLFDVIHMVKSLFQLDEGQKKLKFLLHCTRLIFVFGSYKLYLAVIKFDRNYRSRVAMRASQEEFVNQVLSRAERRRIYIQERNIQTRNMQEIESSQTLNIGPGTEETGNSGLVLFRYHAKKNVTKDSTPPGGISLDVEKKQEQDQEQEQEQERIDRSARADRGDSKLSLEKVENPVYDRGKDDGMWMAEGDRYIREGNVHGDEPIKSGITKRGVKDKSVKDKDGRESGGVMRFSARHHSHSRIDDRDQMLYRPEDKTRIENLQFINTLRMKKVVSKAIIKNEFKKVLRFLPNAEIENLPGSRRLLVWRWNEDINTNEPDFSPKKAKEHYNQADSYSFEEPHGRTINYEYIYLEGALNAIEWGYLWRWSKENIERHCATRPKGSRFEDAIQSLLERRNLSKKSLTSKL